MRVTAKYAVLFTETDGHGCHGCNTVGHTQWYCKHNEGSWESLQLQMSVRLGRSLLDLGVMGEWHTVE